MNITVKYKIIDEFLFVMATANEQALKVTRTYPSKDYIYSVSGVTRTLSFSGSEYPYFLLKPDSIEHAKDLLSFGVGELKFMSPFENISHEDAINTYNQIFKYISEQTNV